MRASCAVTKAALQGLLWIAKRRWFDHSMWCWVQPFTGCFCPSARAPRPAGAAPPDSGAADASAGTPSASPACPPHPGFMGGLCIRCGALRDEAEERGVALSYIHRGLEVSRHEAERLRQVR